MSALDNLPPDQRAVLQMVLQRGRSYDEIASLLSIERAAVRQRALDGFDALAPATVPPGPESALVTDYLLGQLPDKVAEQVFAYLQASDADRAWAQAIVELIAPLAPGSLPEIPVGAPLGADDRSPGGLEPDSDPPPAHEHHQDQPEPAAPREAEARSSAVARTRDGPPTREPRPSSRRGGAILLGGIGALLVAVVLVVVLGGGSKPNAHRKPPTGSVTTVQTASTTATTGTGTTTTATTTTTTTSTTPPAQILAALNLTSPNGVKSTIGIAQVIRVDGVIGVVVDASGVPANGAHNAYAVWLYNSPTSFRFVGFVPDLVGKNGKLAAEGKLRAGAGRYHRLLVTLETQKKPSGPGEVVLAGPFREHT